MKEQNNLFDLIIDEITKQHRVYGSNKLKGVTITNYDSQVRIDYSVVYPYNQRISIPPTLLNGRLSEIDRLCLGRTKFPIILIGR